MMMYGLWPELRGMESMDALQLLHTAVRYKTLASTVHADVMTRDDGDDAMRHVSWCAVYTRALRRVAARRLNGALSMALFGWFSHEVILTKWIPSPWAS